MQAYEVRRWVHRSNGTAALILLFTGTLVTFPDWRTYVLGGNGVLGSNGQVLSDIHLWTGFTFVIAPLLALIFSGPTVLTNIKKRIFGSKTVHWRRVHLSLSLTSGFMLGLTGSIIWIESILEFPTIVADFLFLLHTSFAWALGLALPIHLWMARRGIARVLKQWLGLQKA